MSHLISCQLALLLRLLVVLRQCIAGFHTFLLLYFLIQSGIATSSAGFLQIRRRVWLHVSVVALLMGDHGGSVLVDKT